MFSDTVYGGKEAARRAARKFRGSAMRGLAKPKAPGAKPRAKAKKRAGTKRRR